jgi:PAS domain-containing protein
MRWIASVSCCWAVSLCLLGRCERSIRHRDARERQPNQAALDQLGFRSREDLKRSVVALADDLQTRDWTTGELIPASGRPFVRAVGGEHVVQEVRVRHQLTGEERVLRGADAPVVLDGRVIAAVSVTTDVTEQKRVEQVLRSNENRVNRGGTSQGSSRIKAVATASARGVAPSRSGCFMGCQAEQMPRRAESGAVCRRGASRRRQG